MVLVDTSVWIAYFRGDQNPKTEWLDHEMDVRRIGLTDLNLCEFMQGVRGEDAAHLYSKILLQYEIIPGIDLRVALASSQNYRWLRRRGITIRKTIDCLTATNCILGGHALLHDDRDFEPFEEHLGLKVIHP